MHQIVKPFHDYWTSLKGEGDVPLFLDFNIAEVPTEAVPYLSLIQVEENPRRFKYRLAGTSIAAAYSEDISGKYLDELDMGGNQKRYLEDFNRVVDSRTTNNRQESYTLEDGTRYSFEGWLFPFVGLEGKVSRIVILAVDSYNRPTSAVPCFLSSLSK